MSDDSATNNLALVNIPEVPNSVDNALHKRLVLFGNLSLAPLIMLLTKDA